jgi:hypothetical protein
MRKLVNSLFLLCLLALFPGFSRAQCDTVANVCAKNMARQFLSDGQEYRALLLNNDETAEFHSVFYGGTTYRVVACSGLIDGNLVFSVFDSDRNLLFTNSDYKNAPYWDFKVNSTLDCIIEARLGGENQGSGCAVVLIGFKQ